MSMRAGDAFACATKLLLPTMQPTQLWDVQMFKSGLASRYDALSAASPAPAAGNAVLDSNRADSVLQAGHHRGSASRRNLGA